MTRDELLACLQSIEWSDIEFKEAAWAVPKDALSTVSAFANTAGGHLVFGVKQANGMFAVTGVTDADKVQNDFLGQARDVNKVSIRLPINGTVHQLPEGTALAFYIPEATRQQKPVYLDGNPKKAHVRRGGRDDTCTGDELLRFIRDASNIRFDAEPLDVDTSRCFDEATVRWYRARFAASNPGRDATAQAAMGQTQLVQSLVQLSAIQWHIVAFTDAPRSITELMGRTGHKQRAFFKRQHLEPLLAGGILKMTVPDKPTSPAQRYVLTEPGVKLKQLHEQQQAAGQPENEDHGH